MMDRDRDRDRDRDKDSDKSKKRKRVMVRRRRTLDPNVIIDYKLPEILRRFISDRGKIIPRRISGATSKQQREISRAIKRARYLGLIHCTVAHTSEKGFHGEMSYATTAPSYNRDFGGRPRFDRSGGGDSRPFGGDRGERGSGAGGGFSRRASQEEE